MLQTDQRSPGVDDLGNVKANADGSYGVYFEPQAPKGNENHWIQTVPGKGWNAIFRLQGSLHPFYDKTGLASLYPTRRLHSPRRKAGWNGE